MNVDFHNWLDTQSGAFVTEEAVLDAFPDLEYAPDTMTWTWNTDGAPEAKKSDWRAAHRVATANQ